jgi:hypothetical protein
MNLLAIRSRQLRITNGSRQPTTIAGLTADQSDRSTAGWYLSGQLQPRSI